MATGAGLTQNPEGQGTETLKPAPEVGTLRHTIWGLGNTHAWELTAAYEKSGGVRRNPWSPV